MKTVVKERQKLTPLESFAKRIIDCARSLRLIQEEAYHLVVDVSHCNLKCVMCPRGGVNDLNNPDKGLMEFEQFKRIVDKFVAEKVRIDGLEIGNWGDPILNPQLPEIIRYVTSHPRALKRNSRVFVNTTLNSLPNPLELLKSGVADIRISISGMTQQVYSKNHKGGNIDRVLNNIKKLAEVRRTERLEKVKMRIVFHDYIYNSEDAEAARKFCDEYGLRFTLHRAYILSVGDAASFAKNTEALGNFYRDFIDLDQELPKMKTMDYKEIANCRLRKKRVTVNFDGQLYRCCGVFEKEHLMGSVFDFNIRDIPDIESDVCLKCAQTPISWRP